MISGQWTEKSNAFGVSSAAQRAFFSFSVRSTPAKRSFAPAQPLVPNLFLCLGFGLFDLMPLHLAQAVLYQDNDDYRNKDDGRNADNY